MTNWRFREGILAHRIIGFAHHHKWLRRIGLDLKAFQKNCIVGCSAERIQVEPQPEKQIIGPMFISDYSERT
jgi:hypothetical protein